MSKQLYRPKRNRVIAGVCSGFAEYFGIDAVIIRIITIVIALSGTGILAYIIAAVIMPGEESVQDGGGSWKSGTDGSADDFFHQQEKDRDEWAEPPKYNSERNKLVIGVILVGLGVMFLLKQFIPDFDYKILVPVVLIGIGGVIILKGRH